MAAPATWPASSASARAGSSIRPPRAQLMIRTPGFILRDLLGADEVAGLGRQGGVQGDVVALAPEVVEPADALDAELQRLLGGEERVEAEDRHVEALRPLGDGQADAAQADDAERLAFELGAGELACGPSGRPSGSRWPGRRCARGRASGPWCARRSRPCCRRACSSRRSPAGWRRARRCCRRRRRPGRSP